ncbi:hypothetical protein CANCADRAFT_139801 [Tortispora caseinolytica NRRL Y-17796]|uniref:Eisosome protein 1 n=1 Tax=Tortispora caseinolytica NRRL Y-17796 TaxID=767744 RepID=A0A1E4TCM3_9ASCO|nr:hypothetical protein CANCADRAFT_139801 [Tortispora caseinolytica NRRL Y-17796]
MPIADKHAIDRRSATENWLKEASFDSAPNANHLPNAELTAKDRFTNRAAATATDPARMSADTQTPKKLSATAQYVRTMKAGNQNLPSKGKIGVDNAASGAAATLATNAKLGPNLWKPSAIPDANTAATRAGSIKSPEAYKPKPSATAGTAASYSTKHAASPKKPAPASGPDVNANKAAVIVSNEFADFDRPLPRKLSESASAAALRAVVSPPPFDAYQIDREVSGIDLHNLGSLESAARKRAAQRLSTLYQTDSSLGTKNPPPEIVFSATGRRSEVVNQPPDPVIQLAKQYQSVMTVAKANVDKRLISMEKDMVYRNIYHDKKLNDIALSIAEKGSKERLEKHGKIDMGGGLFMTQSEIEAIAQKNVQPVLDEITEAAAVERARQEEIKAQQAEEARQREEERKAAAEAKAEERAKLKEQKAKEKAELEAKKAEERAEAEAARKARNEERAQRRAEEAALKAKQKEESEAARRARNEERRQKQEAEKELKAREKAVKAAEREEARKASLAQREAALKQKNSQTSQDNSEKNESHGGVLAAFGAATVAGVAGAAAVATGAVTSVSKGISGAAESGLETVKTAIPGVGSKATEGSAEAPKADEIEADPEAKSAPETNGVSEANAAPETEAIPESEIAHDAAAAPLLETAPEPAEASAEKATPTEVADNSGEKESAVADEPAVVEEPAIVDEPASPTKKKGWLKTLRRRASSLIKGERKEKPLAPAVAATAAAAAAVTSAGPRPSENIEASEGHASTLMSSDSDEGLMSSDSDDVTYEDSSEVSDSSADSEEETDSDDASYDSTSEDDSSVATSDLASDTAEPEASAAPAQTEEATEERRGVFQEHIAA